jgi:hypothetical protein
LEERDVSAGAMRVTGVPVRKTRSFPYKKDHLAKTGSRQHTRKTQNNQSIVVFCSAASVSTTGSYRVSGSLLTGAKNVSLLRHFILKRTFYQDRLGTNIGKALQKRDDASFAGHRRQLS